jgi:hypothetical protein
MSTMHMNICLLFFATADLIYNTQTYHKTHSVVLPIYTATTIIKNMHLVCDAYWMKLEPSGLTRVFISCVSFKFLNLGVISSLKLKIL